MKIKLDENLSKSHKRQLQAAGHDVVDVHDEGLSGAADEVVWQAVCAEKRFLITMDHDFADVRRLVPGSHAGLLLLRTTHPSAAVAGAIVGRVLRETDDLKHLEGCLAVADETRTRVRRPPAGRD